MAVAFINGKAALAVFMQDIADDVLLRIEGGGYNASGAMRRSITTETFDSFGTTTSTLSAAAHWRYIGNGRGPGKMPPIAPLVRWAKDKGLASTDKAATGLAFAVAKSIARDGSLDHQLGGKNQFSEAILAAQDKVPDVLTAFLKDIEDPVISQFNKAFAA